MPPKSNRAVILIAGVPLLLLAATLGYQHLQHQQALLIRAETITGGDAERGRRLFSAYGCGGCHQLSGIAQARGLAGPTLDGIGTRVFLGGRLENKPENLTRWIADPQGIAPGTAMPNLGVTPQDSRDIAAFLYLRS